MGSSACASVLTHVGTGARGCCSQDSAGLFHGRRCPVGEQEESRSSELRRTVLPSGHTQPHIETAELRYDVLGFPVGVGWAAGPGQDGTVILHMPSLF